MPQPGHLSMLSAVPAPDLLVYLANGEETSPGPNAVGPTVLCQLAESPPCS